MNDIINKNINNILIIIIFVFSTIGCDNEINKPDEKQKDYLEYGNVINNGLIAYYPFDGDTEDYSGREFHGIENGVSLTTGRFDQPKGAIKFDGIDDYVEIPEIRYINGKSGTICFWVRISHDLNVNGESAIISKTDTTGAGYVICTNDSYNFWFEIKNQYLSGGSIWYSGYSKEQYIFLALTFSEGIIKRYSHGQLVREDGWDPPEVAYFNNVDQSMFIGKSLQSSRYDYFEGEIDDLLIYDRELNEEEILQLYNWQ